jgi:hypothetical protein
VGTSQFAFGVLIVVVTAGLGLYYGWRQWQTLRRLRGDDRLPDDERLFLRNMAWRRLTGSALMILFAVVFVGLFFLEGPINQLEKEAAAAREAADARGEKPTPDASQIDFLRLYGGYVIVLLLLVLGFIAIAGYELFAIRRYSVHHMRRIMDERRAMIASETARLRRERNGHG